MKIESLDQILEWLREVLKGGPAGMVRHDLIVEAYRALETALADVKQSERLSVYALHEIQRGCERYRKMFPPGVGDHDDCTKDLMRLLESHKALETALAEREAMLEEQRQQTYKAVEREHAAKKAYADVLKAAKGLAACADLLSDSSLRVGEFDSETDTWPIYLYVGGLHNECSGTIAEFSNEKLAHAFVKYHHEATAFLNQHKTTHQGQGVKDEGK